MPSSHVNKVNRKSSSDVDHLDLEVHFSPTLKKAFNRLAKAVHGKPHFSHDTYLNLKSLSSNRLDVQTVVMSMVHITEDTMLYVQATNGQEAQDALSEITGWLVENKLTCLENLIHS